MVVETKQRVWGFALVVTVVSLVVAEVLNVLLFPKDILETTMRGTFYIVALTSFPIAWYVGWIMYQKSVISMQLRDLVDRDRLTDVATRDFFFARLLEFPDAYGVSLMVDIDHFKSVNDTHGHLAGDAVIHMVAQVMRSETREHDIVCRFGGEEFVVFLHGASGAKGSAIAERIRASIERTTAHTQAGDIKVTVSVGGSMKERIEHIDEAIRRADDCLYLAKARGRNRTVMDWEQNNRQGRALVAAR